MTQAVALNRLIAVIVALLAAAALKWSYPVTMPIAAAAFLLAVVWPMKPWLDDRLPGPFSNLVIFLSLGAASGGFLVLTFIAVDRVAATLARREEQIGALIERARDWAREQGVSGLSAEDLVGRLSGTLDVLVTEIYAALGYLGLVTVLVLLGLPEIPGFRRRLIARLRSGGEDEAGAFATINLVTRRFRRYLGLTAFTSVLTGLATGLFAWAVGLELALTWGMLNFLLNFVPVIGNIVGMVPPALFAALQFDGWRAPVAVLLGLGVIQITISNVVYPMLQGRGMAMPAVVIVIALTFWGWVWGIMGALLAVPLTAAFLIACSHFESTAWIARLVVGEDRDPARDPGGRRTLSRP